MKKIRSRKSRDTVPLMPFMLRFRSYVDRRCKYALLESINMYYDLKIIHFERGFKRKVAWFSPTFCLFQFAWRIRRPFSFCVKSSAGILEQSMGARKEPSRNRVFVPSRQATKPGGIDSWAP